jgi:hypothetical protein
MKPRFFFSILILNALSAIASPPLWVGGIDLSKNLNIPLIEAEHRVIDECEAGEYQFTLGADIVFHCGEFVAQWANSKLEENDAETMVRGRRSKDGLLWSEREIIAPGFDGPGYHSHGVFLSHEGTLRSFNSQIHQQTVRNGYFQGLCTDVFVFNPQLKKWEKQTVSGLDGFWPLCKPMQLANEKWIMAGAKNSPQTALPRWRSVTIASLSTGGRSLLSSIAWFA